MVEPTELDDTLRSGDDRPTGESLDKACQEKLLDSEAILNSFFNSPGAMRGVIEVEGNDIRHIADNAVTAEFFGRTQESMANMLASQMGVNQEFIDLWIKHYGQSKINNKPVHFEYRHESDQQNLYFSVTVNYLGESKRGFPRFTYVLFDITELKRTQEDLQKAHDTLDSRVEQRTAELAQSIEQLNQEVQERKQVEKRLLESEQIFRRVFEDSMDGMVMADKHGRFINANKALTDILGYSKTEILLKRISDITYPDDIDQKSDNVQDILRGDSEGFTVEKRYIHKSGEIIWSDTTAFPIKDADGNIKYLVG